MDSDVVTDEQLIDAFLEHLEKIRGRRPLTIVTYRHHLQRLVEFLEQQGKSVPEADLGDLERFTGFFLHGEGLSVLSRRPSFSAIRELYRFLNERGLVKDNPARRLESPKVGSALPYAISLQHFSTLFAQADLNTFTGLRDASILAVLGGCGLRVSGLVSLNQEDLVWEVGDDMREMAYLRVTEKGGNERFVPVPDDVFLLLRAYLAHDELQAMDRTTAKGHRVLFVNVSNRRIPPHEYYGEARRLGAWSVWNMIQKYGETANIPREYLHPHSLRHMYGRELAEDGVDLDRRAALLGHRDVSTTRIYDRMSMRRLREAANRSNPMAKIRTPMASLRGMLKVGGKAESI